jgi:hypothetical protein
MDGCSVQKIIYECEQCSVGVVNHFQFSRARLLILKTSMKASHLSLWSDTRIVDTQYAGFMS